MSARRIQCIDELDFTRALFPGQLVGIEVPLLTCSLIGMMNSIPPNPVPPCMQRCKLGTPVNACRAPQDSS